MLSITEITREYKIFNYQIDAWVDEGWFPAYEWHNGRRYWNKNEFYKFAEGCPISLPKKYVNNQKMLPTDFVSLAISAVIAIALSNLF